MVMKGIERFNLEKLCDYGGIDYAEIDSSITYYENKAHICKFISSSDFEAPSQDYINWVNGAQIPSIYNKNAVCPTCGLSGSGFHLKWVLNCMRKKYFPYYYFAHSVKRRGLKATTWCYIKKVRARAILADYELRRKYGLK